MHGIARSGESGGLGEGAMGLKVLFAAAGEVGLGGGGEGEGGEEAEVLGFVGEVGGVGRGGVFFGWGGHCEGDIVRNEV